jgi:4-hydroxybenzoyl-CoA reductase subunit gamma
VGKRILSLTVNGRHREDAVADHTLLLDYLREALQLTGTKRGCDGGECGACTVLVDGGPQLACITLAARCEGKHVETIEALATDGRMSRLQAAFHEQLGTQCGFCTPGMIMTAKALLDENPHPSEEEIKDALSGNFCRCVSHYQVLKAVISVAAKGL